MKKLVINGGNLKHQKHRQSTSSNVGKRQYQSITIERKESMQKKGRGGNRKGTENLKI
jgi:hypothetical protein